jgi:CubicO group peptidase (beta-lactamase class C family)
MNLALTALFAAVPLALARPATSVDHRFPIPESRRSIPDSRFPIADTLGDRLRRELGPWLEDRAKSGGFSGVVLVAKAGTPIYTAVFGMADRARNVPNALDTRFNLGSMNKMWTAIAIAQLVEQGKLDLDATVGRYVPDLPNQSIRETVKVRHLLTHTSGMGSYFRNGGLRNATYPNNAGDFVSLYAGEALSFTPGARMQYSNSGFALLGLIIEKVSGQSFYDYMKRNIIDRGGMTRAAYVDLRSRPTDVAIGYTKPADGGDAVPNWDRLEQRSSPAGGAYASAADLVAFSRALWGGKLTSAGMVKQFTTGQVAMGPSMHYAFGFGVGTLGTWRHVGHNGGAPGVNAEFMMFPDQGIDVVVLANIDGPAASEVRRRVAGALTSTTAQVSTARAGEGGPQIVTVDVGPDGRERRGGNAAPNAMPGGPPATLPPGTPADRLPNNLQGRRAAAFIEAYGKGTGPALATFLEQHAAPRTDRTIEERVKALNGIYDRTGKLTFNRLVGVRDDQIRVAVESAKDGQLTLILFFEPGPPHRVTLFNFEAGERER